MTAPGRDTRTLDSASAATVTGILAAADFRSGDVIADRFRVERLLGMGGMGVVYLAHDLKLDVDVALKLLRPELASRPDAFERFRQELLLARQVSSPHVVRIHDLVQHGPAWLISMDFVAGESLEHRLDRGGPLPPAEAIAITRQLALGLAAAHQRQVVHRDLKPANVLLTEGGDALITDFGVARSAGVTGITGSGVVIGTPDYLSPEQARAETVDGRSDLYALGLILFEMLTGKLPFRDGTPAEMLAQRIVRNPPSVDTLRADLPRWIVGLTARLLELRPAHRFQRADEVIAAIDAERVPGSERTRVRRMAMLLAAVVLAGAGTTLWHAWPLTGAPAATTSAAARPLDLLVLPPEVPDTAIAVTLGTELIAERLSQEGGLAAADPKRVATALAELGFSADEARRHRGRVGELLPARRWLEVAIATNGKDLDWRLVDAADGTVRWQWTQVAPAGLFDGPAAESAIRRALALAPGVAAWPGIDELSRATAPGPADSAVVPQHPVGWWRRLRQLDRGGRSADAVQLAGEARVALAAAGDRESQRVVAYARLLTGDPGGAREALARLADGHRQDHPLRALLARAEAESGDLAAAEVELRELTRDDPRNGDAWYALGMYALMQGHAQQAVDEYLVHAQVLANRLRDTRLNADVANAMGIGYKDLGQNSPALEQLQRAVQLRRELGDARGQSASLRNLAELHAVQGRFDLADAALAEARTLIEPLGDSAALAGLANDTGLLAEEKGDWRAALSSYREALQLRKTQGEPRAVAESLNNVGFAYFQIGDFDNAEVYWQQSDQAYEHLGDRNGRVTAQQNLGLAETARGDFGSARRLLESSLHLAEEQQMAQERAVSLANLADLDRLEGRWGEALEHAEEAGKAFAARDDSRGRTEMTLLRAQILLDLGDGAAAASLIDGLAEDQLGNREQFAMRACRRAEIALLAGRVDDATREADVAIAAAKEAHSLAVEQQAHILRAEAAAPGAARERALAAATAAGVASASVPLRLRLAEALLRDERRGAASDYRQAAALMARLPAWGRGWRLLALAARSLHGDATLAADLSRDADARWRDALAAIPASERPASDALAQRLGLRSP